MTYKHFRDSVCFGEALTSKGAYRPWDHVRCLVEKYVRPLESRSCLVFWSLSLSHACVLLYLSNCIAFGAVASLSQVDEDPNVQVIQENDELKTCVGLRRGLL